MIPISDENTSLRPPFITWFLLATMCLVWIFVQGMGMNEQALAASVCNWGMVAGELTGRAHVGQAVPLGPGLLCVVDRDPSNILTPVTAMFLHGGWGHLLGNGLFLWVFGNAVEDSMGGARYLLFYLVCGLCAGAAQTLTAPASAVPMVGASGAISGVMGAYLVLYPTVRVRMLFIILFFVRIIALPAWLVLVWWFTLQLLSGLPQLLSPAPDDSAGTAFFAHIGGFLAGVLLVFVFANKTLIGERQRWRQPRGPVWQ
jgi:membrane associated rhomboid family serine protease